MRVILNDSLAPYFNLACEECLLDHTDGDIFMLWRNAKSVIIGKNQNAWAEVNTDFTAAENIPVVRRLTGGGAVFHDPGNVNFTFITDAIDTNGGGIDFARFCTPIIGALGKLGIAAVLDGRNDILSDGFKISGNAQCVHTAPDGRRRLMHHGTLLYDADMSHLAGALRVRDEKLKSKGIRSVSSRVKNIREIGGLDLDCTDFMAHMLRCAEEAYGASAETLTADEIRIAGDLRDTKYATWEWNFGASPEYEETRSKGFPYGFVEILYTLRGGAVKSCSIRGDFFSSGDVGELERALTGCRFERSAVAAALTDTLLARAIDGACTQDILSLLGL